MLAMWKKKIQTIRWSRWYTKDVRSHQQANTRAPGDFYEGWLTNESLGRLLSEGVDLAYGTGENIKQLSRWVDSKVEINNILGLLICLCGAQPHIPQYPPVAVTSAFRLG